MKGGRGEERKKRRRKEEEKVRREEGLRKKEKLMSSISNKDLSPQKRMKYLCVSFRPFLETIKDKHTNDDLKKKTEHCVHVGESGGGREKKMEQQVKLSTGASNSLSKVNRKCSKEK